jgi:SNF2 family DNA or RNA helicase
MQNNILIEHDEINGPKVIFRKALWEDQEIALAHAFWMDVHEDGSTVTALLHVTFRKALYSFIEVCYPAFVSGPQYDYERKYLFDSIDTIYRGIYRTLSAKHATALPFYGKFWKHQKQALVSMHHRRCTFLSFHPRMGKTVTTASMSLVHNIQRTLVVTYDIGKSHWMDDMCENWGNEQGMLRKENFTILDRQKSKGQNAFHERFIISNYDSLDKNLPRIFEGVPIGHIILSEAQRCKNHTTRTFKAAEKLIARYPDARLTFESGTPVTNRVNDMFAYFRLARHPLGRSYVDFRRQYVEVNQTYGTVVGSKNISDLQVQMRNFVIRRTQEECTDIPKHRYNNLYFTLSDWKEEYDKALREAMTSTGRRVFESMILSVNRIMALAKVKGIIEHAEMLIEADQKVVIFFGYRDPLMQVYNHFGKEQAVMIDGTLSGKDKSENAKRFMKDPSIKVCVANMTAAGHTIDLSVANHVIMGNFPLSPKTIEQATDRVKNLSKTAPSSVYFCVARDESGEPTVDERLMDLLTGKDSDINWLFDGAGSGHIQADTIDILFKELREKYEKEGMLKNVSIETNV